MKSRSRTRTMFIGGATVLAVAVTSVSAAAVDDTQQADTIASVIADAAPTEEKVIAPDAVTTSSVSFAGHNEVTVPIDAHAPVTIESADSKVDIALPSEINVSDGVVADDGTVVFEDNGNHAHAAVQALDDGSVRLQTILEDPSAPSTYTYAFVGEAQLTLLDDGSVEVTETIADGVATSIGLIDAPWAIDANGTDVPTHYTVEGNNLIQHVDHSDDYAYPITADPKITQTWWNTTVYFNRSETNHLAFAAGGAAAIAAAIPDPTASKIVAALAGVSMSYLAWIYNSGKCVKMVSYGHLTGVWQPYSGSEAGRYCR